MALPPSFSSPVSVLPHLHLYLYLSAFPGRPSSLFLSDRNAAPPLPSSLSYLRLPSSFSLVRFFVRSLLRLFACSLVRLFASTLLLAFSSVLPSRPSPLDWTRAHYGAPCSAYNAPATVPPLFRGSSSPHIPLLPPFPSPSPRVRRRTRLRTCMSTGVTLMTHERIITEATGTVPFSLASLADRASEGSFKYRRRYRKLTSR